MMIANIDFSLFSAPTSAIGNLTGNLTVPDTVQPGDELEILHLPADEWFQGRLTVVSVDRLPGDPSQTLIALKDVVAPSLEEANRLAAMFEKEAGLFFDRYEKHPGTQS